MRMRQMTEDKENLSILHSLLAPEIYARLKDQPDHNTSKAKSQRRKQRKEKKKKAGEIFHIEYENQDEGFFVNEPESLEERKPESSADSEKQLDEDRELGEFVDYIASALLTSLPPHSADTEDPIDDDDSVPASPTSTIPPDLLETLTAYSLFPSFTSATSFLSSILTQYRHSTRPTTAESKPTSITACELCHRSQLPLTAHHLVPRSAAAKAVKRGWRTEEETRNLAWICRSCHSFVHRVESNESLAKSFYTVELLAEREDVGKWVEWVGRQRWGLRRAYAA